jgi:hypothetical protein
MKGGDGKLSRVRQALNLRCEPPAIRTLKLYVCGYLAGIVAIAILLGPRLASQ